MNANADGGSARASNRISRRSAISSGTFPDDGFEETLGATSRWLVDRQNPEGFWVGELEGDTILESEYVLLMAFIGRSGEEVCVKACRYLLDHQLPEGGWAIYPGGPPDLSASVKAYFALKIVGVPFDDPAMGKARRVILDAGGAQGCNSFSRFYLALLGQIGYEECPSVPPELVLIPSRLGFSLSAMSAWTRPILIPLSIMSVHRPVRQLRADQGIAELFREDQPRQAGGTREFLSWTNFFLGVDRLLKWGHRNLPTSWRRPAVRAAHRWMLDHFENTDGLGAIFPPMIYSVVALHCLGYEKDSAPMRWALEHLENLLIEEEGTVRVQPCVSPVWDTAIATIALADAKLPPHHPALL
ncbi:squalene--hopene cyclase, partial [Singulisphaera rosea]